jgi:tetratricopeptide (TPR) repeat protein
MRNALLLRLVLVKGALIAAGLTVVGSSCATVRAPASGQQATSLRGTPLFAPPLAADARDRLQAQLGEAYAAWQQAPGDADAIIWLGRRHAYLGQYQDAIDVFSEGIRLHPRDARLYRHRGHRFITTRQFRRAIADLERAAALAAQAPDQVEPDGQPNARNVPTSTLHSNIWYHLALARYLTGRDAAAAEAWTKARDAVDNPDNLVAATAWLYITLRRSGRDDEALAALAPIRADLAVIENGSYHALLLLHKGERTLEQVLGAEGGTPAGSAVRYGVGAWHALNGRDREARAIWTAILDGPDWPSFGYIAAEMETATPRRWGAARRD